MPCSSLYLRAAFAVPLSIACVADDAKTVAASDGAESAGDLPADSDDPDSITPDADTFSTALDRIEFATSDTRVELLAYDADDQLIGEFALEDHDFATTQFVAEFDDGAALVEIQNGIVTVRQSDLPDEIIARRAEAVGLELASGPQEGWLKCAALAAVTIHNCWNPATALWACGASSFVSACVCLDYLADRHGWLHDEC